MGTGPRAKSHTQPFALTGQNTEPLTTPSFRLQDLLLEIGFGVDLRAYIPGRQGFATVVPLFRIKRNLRRSQVFCALIFRRKSLSHLRSFVSLRI
jgi:hypothetical protein